LKILFLTSGENVPSTRYRILPYVSKLREQGIDCVVSHSRPAKYQRWPILGWRLSHAIRKAIRWGDVRKAARNRYDVIVIEREIFDDPTWNLEAAFRKTTPRLVLDVDDGIFLRYPEKFAQVARMCDHVIAGNEFLAEESRKYCQSVSIVPTSVELAEYPWQTEASRNETPIVGWIGTSANLKYLDEIRPALEELFARMPFTLRIVTALGEQTSLWGRARFPVEFQAWAAETAVEQIQAFDVGVMPLPDEIWERYKCGFKLLQYMAAGVPAVASPVGVNRTIVENGVNGFLAGSTSEWVDAIEACLRDHAAAQRIRDAARNTIEAGYSVEGQFAQFLSALRGE
jgi:glycosyltransferase involved in cell wall biosynthesis